MSDSVHSHDISISPRRYLQRPWKRNKPHLSPSDSLPALRLCPNRPLFVCAQCGFANAWIPLCLWCRWTSAEATKQFEANLPRPRRLSAPSRAVPPLKTSSRHPRSRVSVESTISSAGPNTPQSEQAISSIQCNKDVPGITTVLETFHRNVCHNDGRSDPRNVALVGREVSQSVVSTNSHNVQQGKVDGGGVHRANTAISITPPLPTFSFPNVAPEPEAESFKRNSGDRDLRSNSKHHWRGLPALRVHSSFTGAPASCPSTHSTEKTVPDKVMTMKAMDSSTSVLKDTSNHTPRSTGSLDMSDGGHMGSTPSISSSQCSPRRGLRRTKNMTLLKRGSSASVRSRSPLRESVDVCPTSPVDTQQSHVLSLTPSHDRDAPPVRLGHPSRPYYSAIRKDMSRPTSPVFSIIGPRTPSPIPSYTDYIPRGTKSLDCGDRSGMQYAQELRPMSMVLSSRATSPVRGSGFSLSGEMELRMNLARWQRENAPNEPGGYHFREMSRSPIRVNMKRKVKQLGRGLKELVLGRL